MNDRSNIQRIKFFLLDMDGTLYRGTQLFSFTSDLLHTLRESGRKYLFMTNNSSKSAEDHAKKLKNLGIEAEADDFITSSQATAYYIKEKYPNARLYVCGTSSLKQELELNGLAITENLAEVNCLIVGYDTELSYKKLEDVCRLLYLYPDLPYIATHPDVICPTEFGNVPDCGSMCDMIFNATGKRPVVIGKPSSLMAELAMKQYGFTKEETAIIGDRIYTDIKSAINAGITGILVMSGETTPQILEESKDKPDFVLKHAGELVYILTQKKRNATL